MATLTSQQLKDSYQSLVTIGDSITSNPTSGQLENGLGNAITALGIGTDSPDTILELDGGTSYEHLKISASGNTSRFMKIGMDSATEHTIEASGPQCFLTFKTGTTPTEKMRIDSSGNVGIGTTSIHSNYKTHIEAGSGNNTSLLVTTTDNADVAQVIIGHDGGLQGGLQLVSDKTNGIAKIRVTNSSYHPLAFEVRGSDGTNERMRIDSSGNVTITTGNLILDSGAGIDFSDTPNSSGTMTSELLDDYEEGDWSPTFVSTTPDATNPMSVTVDSGSSSGKYIKIGAQVTVFGRLQTDGITLNDDPSSDACVISGLPFVTGAKGSGSIGRVRGFTNAPDGINVQLSVSRLDLQKSNQGADFTLGDLLDGSNKNSIFFNATYFTNS